MRLLESPWLPAALGWLAFGAMVVSITRTPLVWHDEVVYSSIARAMQLTGSGVPTVLEGRSTADHVALYGPVYFALAAAAMDLFGPSMAGVRAVGVAGALVAAVAAGLLARWVGGTRRRQWWAFAIVLLTPEVGYAATGGRMDTVALGGSLLALAVYARGLERQASMSHGVGAGALLGAAMLTTPRVYPFAAVFVGAALLFSLRGGSLRQVCWLVGALAVGVVAWGTFWFGSPVAWVELLWQVLTRYDAKVAVLPDAVRQWDAARWFVLTPLAAGIGGLVTVLAWRRGTDIPRPGAMFGLSVSAANFILMLAVMNDTFSLGIYFAVGLLVAVIATVAFPPLPGRSVMVVFLAILVTAQVGLRVVRTARLAETWDAGNPDAIEQFVRSYVPTGSYVFGPDAFYFYAVERAGSRYLLAEPSHGQRWTSLVASAPASPLAASRPRFVIWPVDDDLVGPLPPAFSCAGPARARYEPPRYAPPSGVIAVNGGLMPSFFPASVLRPLPPGCGI